MGSEGHRKDQACSLVCFRSVKSVCLPVSVLRVCCSRSFVIVRFVPAIDELLLFNSRLHVGIPDSACVSDNLGGVLVLLGNMTAFN